MFHRKVSGGSGEGNNVSSFSGKSGNIICLNDGAGIDIKDKAGNFVTLSGTGNVTTINVNGSQFRNCIFEGKFKDVTFNCIMILIPTPKRAYLNVIFLTPIS